MSVLEPPPDDGDDPLFAELEGIFEGVDTYEVVDVTKLDNDALLTRFHELTEQIKARREVLAPRTDEGRELHSLRAAMSIELRNRGILG